jgi:salicylate hydroxylase
VDIFKQYLPDTCTIHLSKRLTGYSAAESGAITLHFEDGTFAETDVLIGADGIRFATHASLFQAKAEGGGIAYYQTYIQPTWSGTVAYRCVVPAKKVSASNQDHLVLANSMNVISCPCYPGICDAK